MQAERVVLFMIEFPEMPYNKKFEGIQRMQRLVENFAPRLVKNELGDEKLNELQKIWREESEQIPPKSTDKDKYEIAYKNFLQSWVSANRFMEKHEGEDGVNKFMRAAIDAWKLQYSNQALLIKVFGRISSKNAFKMLATRLAYQLQVFSPYTVSELTDDKMILDIAPCKIIGTRIRNDFCLMACQNIIPAWLEAQFNVKMNLNPQGGNCTATFTPFN